MANPKLLGVVLAGGRSSRMGRDKAGLTHPSGGTYLSFSINRLTSLCDEVVVSGETSVDHSQKTLPDEIPHQGPIHGIRAALAHARSRHCDACLITPIDMPDLGTADLSLVVDAWNDHQSPVCAYSDRIEPLVAIYPIDLLTTIQARIDSGQRSLYRWIDEASFQLVSLSIDACRNINHSDDLS